MKNFGYTLQKDRQIDYDKNDKRIIEFVRKFEPTVNICIACGTCTATCTAAQFTDFNIRMVHTLMKRGETDRLAEEIAKCQYCGKCLLACPRGVNTRNMILGIKKAVDKILRP
ncbi:MAG: 4Fe-4S dicluster domain-containing protein [Bacteroidota bacterium]